MKGLDEYITRDDRQQLPEEVYTIEDYEELGTFESYGEAVEYLLTTELSEKEFPEDYIYIKEEE